MVGGYVVRVDCRGGNHRGFDLRVHAPSELRWVEEHTTNLLKDRIVRGRVEVRIEIQASIDGGPGFRAIDEERFREVAQRLQALARANDLAGPVSMEAVLAFQSYFERSTSKMIGAEHAEDMIVVVTAAIDEFVTSRENEGRGIATDMMRHLGVVKSSLTKVRELRATSAEELRLRSRERLQKVLADFEIEGVDENRVAQEIAIFVDRGDIAEELQRAGAHIERLEAMLSVNDDEHRDGVGKKLDFYLQEMVRETNTMGSKSQHAALSDLVIEMKSRIEKMREQAANIE